jgi:hypothetical protein
VIAEARRSRATIAAMTAEQRTAMGLPAVGWERVVWNGLGLDDEGSLIRRIGQDRRRWSFVGPAARRASTA